ncbi:Longin-like domain-containing protein [Aspergillus karnatakaensis]|uniref:palmitoyltransferase YKT6 n=1 Tax=Aspergillus karnatakaensis TaxID=1810916 RepID=UPI003CCDF64E
MKIIYIGVLRNVQPDPIELCCERELSSYSRFTRGSIQEFTTMFSKLLTGRTQPGNRLEVLEKDFKFHIYASDRFPGITGVIISDDDYQTRPAQSVLSKLIDEFMTKNPSAASANGPIPFPALRDYITQYQDPENADKLGKMQRELDETTAILHKTIDTVLQRGEKLDDLVQKSEGLSSQSKMFYTSAKKQNSCCIIM